MVRWIVAANSSRFFFNSVCWRWTCARLFSSFSLDCSSSSAFLARVSTTF
ncbi:hypothetical protein [Fretibacterium fastidiosum]